MKEFIDILRWLGYLYQVAKYVSDRNDDDTKWYYDMMKKIRKIHP